MEGAAEQLPVPIMTTETSSAAVAHTPKSQATAYASGSSLVSDVANSSLVRCLLLDSQVLRENRAVLRSMVEFGCLMTWYYVCDRTHLIPAEGKSYSRDTLMFLLLTLTVVAAATSLQSAKQPAVLGRQQTEEWKGWMQVLFLLYHYFEAKELYNAIRLLIAGYVWMTGFGNFMYYYKTGDYSIGRFAQMMWRLNFLVFFACVVLRNSLMLYYICPMHTLFTVAVYASLGIAHHLNKSDAWLLIKLLCCLGGVALLWDVKPVFYALWSPFTFIMGYQDPRKPLGDPLHGKWWTPTHPPTRPPPHPPTHPTYQPINQSTNPTPAWRPAEWYFRSSLDRYIWIYGMLCAYLHPRLTSSLTAMDALPPMTCLLLRKALLLLCAGAAYLYYVHIFCLPKLEYNKAGRGWEGLGGAGRGCGLHPYTSWIPITLWLLLRNLTPRLRLHHLRLYGWLGCITLETYISQFHIWMKTGMPDGQPKQLLVVLPGYPLVNFALVTAGYIFVSHRLFELTNAFKTLAVPHSNNQLLLRNTLLLLGAGGLVYMAAACVMQLHAKFS
ncbi:hypothetical protein QJQ45_019558 [Haematococcus lacustris]|nr:hypothetical protein QJQ45_019558 [Haematococcus lacustris]